MTITVQQRNAEMVRLRRKGVTLEEIGQRFGLTRERVRQIIKEIDPSLVRKEVRKIQKKVRIAKVEASREAIRSRIYGDWSNLSYLTISQISSKLKISEEQIKDALPNSRIAILRGNEKRPVSNLQQFSDAEIKKALREAAAIFSPITAKKYMQLLKSGEIYGPTVARLNQRFGSWRAACEFARVPSGQPIREYSREWSNPQLFKIVIEFLSDTKENSQSFQAFEAWLQRHPGYPSGQTVRNYLGSWRIVKADALRQVPKVSKS